MKVTDLMINDLVYYIDGEQPIPVVVKMIDGKCDVVCLRQSDGHLFHATIDSLLPISLTPEILEKNEIDTVFKTRYKGFYLEYHAEAGTIMLYVYNNGSFQPTGIGFKYVHELQHALRLCGIEKEITIKED